jgi:hypothetical protein
VKPIIKQLEALAGSIMTLLSKLFLPQLFMIRNMTEESLDFNQCSQISLLLHVILEVLSPQSCTFKP